MYPFSPLRQIESSQHDTASFVLFVGLFPFALVLKQLTKANVNNSHFAESRKGEKKQQSPPSPLIYACVFVFMLK